MHRIDGTLGNQGFGPVSYTHLDVYKRQVQQLAAAAHKGQALLVLALARAFAHKQYLSSLDTLPEHHMGAVSAQLTSAAGKACLLYTSRCV